MQPSTGSSFPYPLPNRKEEDYAEAKQALSEGLLQTRNPDSDVWEDWPYTGGVGFIFPADCYRRKPSD